ncbi:MAG: bifunctional nuclease family protein [Dysgonamonadaceae bacterium]|jgi:bifunctional DNase/RNase|nr:bifunctional nuclease family protein [Dysgonamonadaceae bacterium]
MIKLKILGITFSQVQAGAYALVLTEEGGSRRVPIIIGTPEAQSIAITLEGLIPPRPLTHDLFITFAKSLNAELKQVNIYKYEDGVFYSELVFDTKEKTVCIDARTSDAISLAIRTDAPIFITEEIMRDVCVFMTEGNWEEFEDIEENEKQRKISFETMNFEELQISLNDAIINEDYEKASYIRDLINKLNPK